MLVFRKILLTYLMDDPDTQTIRNETTIKILNASLRDSSRTKYIAYIFDSWNRL